MLVSRLRMKETEQSLHWGPVKIKHFLPGLQLQAGRGRSGLSTNAIQHLYSSSEFTGVLLPAPSTCPVLSSPACCGCSVSVYPRRIWGSSG